MLCRSLPVACTSSETIIPLRTPYNADQAANLTELCLPEKLGRLDRYRIVTIFLSKNSGVKLLAPLQPRTQMKWLQLVEVGVGGGGC